MRRPLVLATALAAELAVGTLALAPPATAQPTSDRPADQPSVEPLELDPAPIADDQPGDQQDAVLAPVRTGRSDSLPVDAPTAVPDAATAVPASVRSGRLDALGPDLATQDPTGPGEPASTVPSTPRARADRSTSTSSGSAAPTPPEPNVPSTTTPGPASPTPESHVVARGDHLWAIAADRVAAASGRAAGDLTPGDVVTYWVQLCMQNRPHLRSGNPSLIYPGEVIELPPIA